jgi:hypothetical protein
MRGSHQPSNSACVTLKGICIPHIFQIEQYFVGLRIGQIDRFDMCIDTK